MGPQRIPRGRAGGRCVRKWRFSNKETAFAGYNIFSGDFILYSERNEHLGAMRQKMAISEWETAFAGSKMFSGALIFNF